MVLADKYTTKEKKWLTSHSSPNPAMNSARALPARTRRAGRIPAVIYGHGGDPVHVSLPGHATMMALKHANALFEIESTDGAKNVLTIARDVQTDVVTREIEHLDLIIVKRGEKIEVRRFRSHHR